MTEHFIASYYSKHDPVAEPGQIDLGQAIRSFRLGHSAMAIGSYKRALQKGISPRQEEIALIGLVKCLRLSCAFEQTRYTIANALAGDRSPQSQNELLWEQECLEIMIDGNPHRLWHLLLNSHFSGDFVAEAYLWACAYKERNWHEAYEVRKKPGLISAMRRHPKSNPLVGAALAIRDLYDTQIPFSVRLRNLRQIYAMRPKVITFDKELLILAALGRWLSRNRQYEFAKFINEEYNGLCLQISAGSSNDVLKVSPA